MLSVGTLVRSGAVLSAIAHLVLAVVVLGLFAHPKLFETTTEPVFVDIVAPADVPKGETAQAQTQGPDAAKPSPAAAQPQPQASPPSSEQPKPAGHATFTSPQPAKTPPSVFAPTQIPALLDLVTPATSDGLAPLAEVQADITADDISAFKAHLRKCWSAPADLAADPKLKVVLRVFLARNGTLAQQPVLMAASASPSGPALVQTATAALRRCAPFSFLPADRYKEWKVLDLTLSVGDMGGG